MWTIVGQRWMYFTQNTRFPVQRTGNLVWKALSPIGMCSIAEDSHVQCEIPGFSHRNYYNTQQTHKIKTVREECMTLIFCSIFCDFFLSDNWIHFIISIFLAMLKSKLISLLKYQVSRTETEIMLIMAINSKNISRKTIKIWALILALLRKC
jgi:hypothetical protein